MSAIKVGIIGAGMIAHGSHAEAFGKEPDVEIAAVADLDGERGKAFAEKYSIPRVFTSYDEMLRDVDLDAVSVALPVFLHAPAAIAALKAGKHVLCEKPMARNLSEAEEMVATAHKQNRKLQVYWRMRFSREGTQARELIRSGRLGDVHYVRTIGLRWRGRPGFDTNMSRFGKWFGHKNEAGGGTLMDIGGYAIDLVMGLLGFPEVASVSGVTFQGIDRDRAQQEGYDVEDFAVGLIRLRNGACISLESAFASNLDGPNNTWFFGTRAGLKMDPLTLSYPNAENKKVEEAVDLSEVKSISPVHQFISAIKEDKPIAISSGDEALTVQRLQDALYRSAAAGHEIKL